jgi:hypothetical protein
MNLGKLCKRDWGDHKKPLMCGFKDGGQVINPGLIRVQWDA